jgi:hypothetical protein
MLRISDFDWPRLLLTRSAAILLGAAAALSLGAVVIIHSDLNLDSISPIKREVLSVFGAGGAFGFLALLICMSVFWLQCDSSSKALRTFWFVILLVGFPYGSAILYYLIVYLPAFRKGLHGEGSYSADIQPQEPKGRNRLGPFSRLLLIIWAVILLPVALVLTLPRIPSAFARITAIAFFVWSAIVILDAVLHTIVSLYRSGMSRPASPDSPDSSRPKNRD